MQRGDLVKISVDIGFLIFLVVNSEYDSKIQQKIISKDIETPIPSVQDRHKYLSINFLNSNPFYNLLKGVHPRTNKNS